jgi:hypothetical protein
MCTLTISIDVRSDDPRLSISLSGLIECPLATALLPEADAKIWMLLQQLEELIHGRHLWFEDKQMASAYAS